MDQEIKSVLKIKKKKKSLALEQTFTPCKYCKDHLDGKKTFRTHWQKNQKDRAKNVASFIKWTLILYNKFNLRKISKFKKSSTYLYFL